MGRNDMNHMQHLESVALSDCAVLESKEATYQGSWKRAGGRSAWFMARRNMDRLLTMMPAKPVNHEISNFENIRGTLMSLKQSVHYNFAPLNQTVAPLPGSIEGTMAVLEHVLDSYTADDVFARIAASPKGEDGTVLACIRDLRRYFVLVEAEMIAERVVEPESRTYETESYPVDVYQMIADEKKLGRRVVKDLIHDLFYSDIGDKCRVMLLGADVAKPPPVTSNGGYAKEQAERHPQPTRELSNSDPVLASGLIHRPGHPPRQATEAEIAEMTGKPSALSTMRPIGTPEDGGHHASLVPWEINDVYRNILIERLGGDGVVNAFYTKRALDVYRLEPIVSGVNKCPREINDCYDWWTHGLSVDSKINLWVLKRAKVPAELTDQFPLLQAEMNTVEYEQSAQEFRFMYVYEKEKWILASSFRVWARES